MEPKPALRLTCEFSERHKQVEKNSVVMELKYFILYLFQVFGALFVMRTF